MKTNEEKNANEAVSEIYVKPSMEVYEMEMEGVIMSASGDDVETNGGAQSSNRGLPWDKY